MFVADLLVDELVRRKITTFCISPGSRSTPLTLAAIKRDNIDIIVNIDERASAYYAVGYARATGQAAAVICTSGTATANMYPAVIEACHSRLPMVLLTADRPEELQNIGANQTINQENLYGRYVAASLTIPAPSKDFEAASFLSEIDTALKNNMVPVHINCRFREPLAPIEQPYDYEQMQEQVDRYRRKSNRESETDSSLNEPNIEEIKSITTKAEKGLIIAGPETPFRACRGIVELSRKLQWPLIADILSQNRGGSDGHFMAHYDLYLDIESVAEKLRPDIVLQVGGLPTSKRLNQFLLDSKGVEQIKIQDHNIIIDPDRVETRRIVCPPDEFIDRLNNVVESRTESEYYRLWRDIENRCREYLKGFFDGNNLTESSLAYSLVDLLPARSSLYVSSSMPVRDLDTFLSSVSIDTPVGANRGASGIDGVIASACGFAAGCERPTTLLIGDLAFLHDLNSLAIAARSDFPITIIVINNNGGGIFNFLPVARLSDQFEKYFATPHGLTFEKAAALFDLPYHNPGNMDDFRACYKKTSGQNRSAVIEITTDRVQNLKEHEAFRSKMKKVLSGSEAYTG
jgi:2-succinyl-5-enolpyruvyl-6-hydroxy-3-cyclohexene-1-carboxylate synthase